MREIISQTLFEYWNDLRAGRLAPRRFEIEPAQIASLLPDTFILERPDPQTARFRLAGTRICDAFRTEFRGINLFELINNADRVTLERQMAVISRQGAAGVFTFQSETPTAHVARWEMLVLPLVHLSGEIDRFLGSIAMQERPDWLGHEPLGHHRLLDTELIWPEGRPHQLADAARRQAPFRIENQEVRIVRSNRRQFRVYDGGLAKPDDT